MSNRQYNEYDEYYECGDNGGNARNSELYYDNRHDQQYYDQYDNSRGNRPVPSQYDDRSHGYYEDDGCYDALYADYSRDSEYLRDDESNAKKSRAKIIVKNISVTVASLILIVINIAVAIVWGILGKIDYISYEEPDYYDEYENISNPAPTPVDSTSDIVSETDTVIIDENSLVKLAKSYGATVDENGLMSKEGIKNYLLLGADSRYRLKKKWNCNTDAIIIASVDENNKKITLTSIMRDIYVYIPGRNKYDKINSACAYNGGPTRTVKVVENTFGVNIDNFVIVSFYSFIDIVNALGGVTVDIDSGEQKWINEHIKYFNRNAGYSDTHGQLQYTGKDILLTGKQAMGYVRVRYSGNGDYERTERQREVLEQLIQKARKASYTKLIKLIDKVAGYISTDFTSDELLLFAADAVNYLDYSIEQFRVPIDGTYDGHYVSKDTWALEIELEPNKTALYNTIFGEPTA